MLDRVEEFRCDDDLDIAVLPGEVTPERLKFNHCFSYMGVLERNEEFLSD